MYKQWILFRDPLPACGDPVQEGKIEFIFVIDERYAEDEITILLYTEDGDELFNSYSDHLFHYNDYPDMSVLEVDLCVPRGGEYLAVVRDNLAGDGFTNGILYIYLDGELDETLQGNFGDSFNTTIQFPIRTYTPSKSPSASPTATPTTARPSAAPTNPPTNLPTRRPTTSAPTKQGFRVIFPSDSSAYSPGVMQKRRMIWIFAALSLVVGFFASI